MLCFSKQGLKHAEGWTYGGCSDNVDYGVYFARNFIDALDRIRNSTQRGDVIAMMNLHNNDVGRKVCMIFIYYYNSPFLPLNLPSSLFSRFISSSLLVTLSISRALFRDYPGFWRSLFPCSRLFDVIDRVSTCDYIGMCQSLQLFAVHSSPLCAHM